jgi:hypothetical protein
MNSPTNAVSTLEDANVVAFSLKEEGGVESCNPAADNTNIEA